MADKKHNFSVTELKAGLFVLASLALLVLFIAVVSGLRPETERKTFHTYFRDTAGLNRGADVRFGGMKCGRVLQVAPSRFDQSLMEVIFYVLADVPVNVESVASIGQVTLTAEKHLELTTGDPKATLVADGAEIPSGPGAGGMFGALDTLAGSINDVVSDVRALLGVQEAQIAARGAGQPQADLTTISDILGGVNGTVAESTGAIQDVRTLIMEHKPDIEAILTKLQSIEDHANGLAEQLGGLVADVRPTITQTVEGAHGAVGDVRAILADVQTTTANLETLEASLRATLTHAETLGGNANTMVNEFRPTLEGILLDVGKCPVLKSFSRTISEQPQSFIRGHEPVGRSTR